ncbi:hypothetical protein ACWO4B_003244 [Clostridium sporogenes]
MLEIAEKGKEEVRGIYKEKNYVHWLSSNLIESHGKAGVGKTYLTIKEIMDKELEGDTLLLRPQYEILDNEIISNKELYEFSIYPKNIRSFDIKKLKLNTLNVIDDILDIYIKYKYVIFDEIGIDEKSDKKLLEKIYKLAEKHKDVLFVWIGQESILSGYEK